MSNSKFRLHTEAIELLRECEQMAWRLSGRVEELINDLHSSSVASSTRRELMELEELLNRVINQSYETLEADREVESACVHAVCLNPEKKGGFDSAVTVLLPRNWEVSEIQSDRVFIRGLYDCESQADDHWLSYVLPRLSSGFIHAYQLSPEAPTDETS